MILSDFDHLRSNPMIKFKEELIEDRSYTIISYMIGDKELWEIPMALETRGNTFETTSGKLVSATLPKFFNVGERDDTNQKVVASHFIECYEKRDGSMLTAILTRSGKVMFKTKKSFTSDVAVLANSIAPSNVLTVTKMLLEKGFSPIWEFTHPFYRIVIDYSSKPNFTLLAVRHLETGAFLNYNQLLEIESIDLIPRLELTWDQIVYSVENDTNMEGYVLLLDDGRRVKQKVKWYLLMHHTMTELRHRDIAEAVIEEKIDDIKSLLSSQGKDLEPVEKIESKVADELAFIRDQVEMITENVKGKSVKEVALEFNSHPYFSLIMSNIRGKEPNYRDYWIRNYLKNYSLRCVYNIHFGEKQ